jgi:hypothetical protein
MTVCGTNSASQIKAYWNTTGNARLKSRCLSCGTSWRKMSKRHLCYSDHKVAFVNESGRVDEDEIEKQCDELRKRLLDDMHQGRPGPRRTGDAPRSGKGLKMHQVHELADAKIKQSERLRQALKISRDYEEGGHWKRQEERLKRSVHEKDDVDEVNEDGNTTRPTRA